MTIVIIMCALRVLRAWQQPNHRLGVALVLVCAILYMCCSVGCYEHNATALAEERIVGPSHERPVRVIARAYFIALVQS